jgi:hypothetical protein
MNPFENLEAQRQVTEIARLVMFSPFEEAALTELMKVMQPGHPFPKEPGLSANGPFGGYLIAYDPSLEEGDSE